METLEDCLGCARVEIAGGLIRQQQARLVGQGSGHGHPLLLAAGKLGGLMVQTLGETKLAEKRARPFAALASVSPGDQGRQSDILQSAKFRQQVMELVDEPDRLKTNAGALAIIQRATILASNDNDPGGGMFEETRDVQQ